MASCEPPFVLDRLPLFLSLTFFTCAANLRDALAKHMQLRNFAARHILLLWALSRFDPCSHFVLTIATVAH